jgi:cytosine deaminase
VRPETLRAVAIGGRTADLTIEAGRIARVVPVPGPARACALPLLVDAHVHLDKTHVVDRLPRRARSLPEAIALGAEDRAGWTAEDVRARAGRALAEAEAAGIAALRSHVDWTEPETPLAWDVLGELAVDWRGRVEVERAALAPLELLGDPDAGPRIAAAVAAAGGTLGAFVYRQAHLPVLLEAVFALGLRHGLRLDFHVDEGLDREAQGFDVIVALARRLGLAGRVLCGHACALAVRPEAEVARLLDEAAAAGVALTVLPTTNSWLQDAQAGRTPRLIGLAPMHEARAAGMDVLVALDNVRDAYYPYGDYDLIDAWRLAVLNAHLDPASWFDALTDAPRRALGLEPARLAEGAPADFLLLEAAGVAAMIDHARLRPAVWRRGRPLDAAAPALRASA